MSRIKRIMKNRLARNFMVLLTGEGIVSIIGMVNLAIIINTIGLDKNGFIIMVQTYAMLFNNIFGFKSFLALIKYLSIAIENKDGERIRRYIKQSFILDIGAAVLAVLFGYIFLDFVLGLMGWDASIKPYIRIYLAATVFYIQGTTIGILRVYNKFNFITYINVTINLIKLCFYSFGFFMKFGMEYFFGVEVMLFLIQNLLLLIFSYNTLREHGLQDFYRVKTGFDRDFIAFNFYSNITSTLDIPVGYLTTMILNRYLGFAEISVYKIFEKLGAVIGKLGSPLNQIIYPEMSFMIAKKEFKGAKRLSDRLFLGITGIGAAFIVFILVSYRFWMGIFIDNYSLYIGSLILYFAFIIFTNATTGVHNLFMALGYMKLNVPIILVINPLYLVVLYYFISAFGLNGVISALFIQAVAVIVVKIIIMNRKDYREFVPKRA